EQRRARIAEAEARERVMRIAAGRRVLVLLTPRIGQLDRAERLADELPVRVEEVDRDLAGLPRALDLERVFPRKERLALARPELQLDLEERRIEAVGRPHLDAGAGERRAGECERSTDQGSTEDDTLHGRPPRFLVFLTAPFGPSEEEHDVEGTEGTAPHFGSPRGRGTMGGFGASVRGSFSIFARRSAIA